MDIIEEIARLQAERGAVILAHNYQLGEVQDIADYTGDSLGLSVEASQTDARVIVFCGVWFMAETAKILCPDKVVLIPDAGAGCPMADMIDVPTLRELKRLHPRAKAMCYVNSSAAVKAECDICCTSSNATRIAKQAFSPDEEVIFVPDRNLAAFAAREAGRAFIVHDGFCPTHDRIQPEHVRRARLEHPDAEILVHPECRLEVIDQADLALSTGQMSSHVAASTRREFVIGTEEGMLHRLAKDNPGKVFYPLLRGAMICPNMKKTTLRKVYESLRDMRFQVEVEKAIADRARAAITAMLSYKG